MSEIGRELLEAHVRDGADDPPLRAARHRAVPRSATSAATSTRTSARRRSRSARSRALEPDDYIVSTHRGHGHAIAKGHDPRRMMAELFGRETGYCHGRGGSMHVASRSVRNLGRQRRSWRAASASRSAPRWPIQQRGGSEVVRRVLQRRLVGQRDVARVAEPGGDLGPAGHLRAREQPVRGLDADPRQRPGRAPRPSAPRPTGCRASRSTATTP